jgi:hypothetical protein
MPNNLASALDRLEIDLRASPVLDAAWYRAANGDIGLDTDPVRHFLDIGLAQGRSPNAFMDPIWYADRYPDVREAGANPFLHYLEFGWREGRDPGPKFSTEQYLKANPDVRATGQNPFIHFLGSGAAQGGSSVSPRPIPFIAADLYIRSKDEGSPTICQWTRELAFHGIAVRTRLVDAGGVFQRITASVLGRLAAHRTGGSPTLLVSVNGAALTPSVAKAAGRGLIAIFDDVAAARSMRPELRDALSRATVTTTSPAIANVLAGIPGSVSLYAEPMSSGYLQDGPKPRTVPIVWRCPSPQAARSTPAVQMRERSAIAQRLAPHGLVIVSDHAWRDKLTALNEFDLRSDWASQSCARDRYAAAKLAIITPPWERVCEVTADIPIAFASGTLPIAPFSMAQALFVRFGDDCPVALYRNVDELVAIAEHYLHEEEERAALVQKAHKYLFAEPSYSALVGEIVAKVAKQGQ